MTFAASIVEAQASVQHTYSNQRYAQENHRPAIGWHSKNDLSQHCNNSSHIHYVAWLTTCDNFQTTYLCYIPRLEAAHTLQCLGRCLCDMPGPQAWPPFPAATTEHM